MSDPNNLQIKAFLAAMVKHEASDLYLTRAHGHPLKSWAALSTSPKNH